MRSACVSDTAAPVAAVPRTAAQPYVAEDEPAQTPMVLALELGRLGDDSVQDDPRQRRLGDSERVFGPAHPSSRLGSYTGNGLGSYTGRGLGSYTGSGLGGASSFGTGNATGGQSDDQRSR